MANAVRKLQADKAKLLTEGRGLLDKAANDNRRLNDEEKARMKAIDAELDGIDEELALAAQFAESERDMPAINPLAAAPNRNPWYAEADRLIGQIDSSERIIDQIQRRGGQYADRASSFLDATSMAALTWHARVRRVTAIGLFLQSVRRAEDRSYGGLDPRLIKAAASGASEAIPSDGGFLVNEDMASDLRAKIVTGSELILRVDQLPLGSNSNRVKINVISETSRANGSRWGGVTTYWAAEADTVTASKPKIEQIALELNKLFGLMYATDELLQDATLLGALAETAFSEELRFKAEDAIFRGTGVGQPLGILASAATVSQAIEATQTIANSNQFIATNTAKMLSRMPASNKGSAVWLLQTELLPTFMNATAGATAGTPPIWMPGQNFAGRPFNTIWGYPVVEIEYAEAVGTPGDLTLADLSQYAMIDKGGIMGAQSMHVRFINDEMTFRWTWRLDGQPKWRVAITPFKGALTRSPFITLAVRA